MDEVQGVTVPGGVLPSSPPVTAQLRSVLRAGGSATSSFTNRSKFHPKNAKEGAELG